MSEWEIRYVGGHVEVYSNSGAFLFSADTVREAMEEGDIKINIEHDTADSVANNNEKSIQNSKN